MKRSNDVENNSEGTISHRLRVIQQLLKIKSVTAFASEIGVDASVLNNIISPYGRQGKPSFDTLQKIGLKFPRVRMEWLITGKGEPLRPYSAQCENTTIAEPGQRQPETPGMPHLLYAAHSAQAGIQPSLEEMASLLKMCQTEKDNLERILALKDELIGILRNQK